MESNLTADKARVCISCGQITRNGSWKQTKIGRQWRCALCLERIARQKQKVPVVGEAKPQRGDAADVDN